MPTPRELWRSWIHLPNDEIPLASNFDWEFNSNSVKNHRDTQIPLAVNCFSFSRTLLSLMRFWLKMTVLSCGSSLKLVINKSIDYSVRPFWERFRTIALRRDGINRLSPLSVSLFRINLMFRTLVWGSSSQKLTRVSSPSSAFVKSKASSLSFCSSPKMVSYFSGSLSFLGLRVFGAVLIDKRLISRSVAVVRSSFVSITSKSSSEGSWAVLIYEK